MAFDSCLSRPHFKKPLLAYGWIEFPTLRELWDELPREQAQEVMRSWGRLAISGTPPVPERSAPKNR